MNENLKDVLAANLTTLMNANEGLNTLVKVSNRSGLSGGTIDRIKKAQVSPTLDSVEAIAKSFNVNPLVLLSPNLERNDIAAPQDIWEVTNAMKELDPIGQTKVRIAALEARDLHLLHLAQMRSKQQVPTLTDDEYELLSLFRSATDEASRKTAMNAFFQALK
jgi:transcriptional regulator with XRE-family HTH domain